MTERLDLDAIRSIWRIDTQTPDTPAARERYAAWRDISTLLAEIERLRSQLDALHAEHAHLVERARIVAPHLDIVSRHLATLAESLQ